MGIGVSGVHPLQEGGSMGQKKLRQCAHSGERVPAIVGVTLDRAQDEYANDQRVENCAQCNCYIKGIQLIQQENITKHIFIYPILINSSRSFVPNNIIFVTENYLAKICIKLSINACRILTYVNIKTIQKIIDIS